MADQSKSWKIVSIRPDCIAYNKKRERERKLIANQLLPYYDRLHQPDHLEEHKS